ncbi:hypothetical protein [Paenibacillus prosopidis]|uniref:DUF3221 domain-containing protein n=1 Tax=Paenibacillus prosopidis TaxID=630520 RepID=A0A368VG14_9BACL|nr:hypothetical protein [Paenibacillus prosopidis]RCW40113.1 hypothetical protein DFP97_1404 [Paenibacillus prosopidis]
MKKIMLFVLVSVLSVTIGCGQEQEQSYLKGIIEEVDEDNIIMLIEKNKSRIGESDKVWLTREQSLDFGALEKGQRIKAWVSDAFVGLTGIPQVIATKIEEIP